MPSGRPLSQSKTLATLAECTEDTSPRSAGGRMSSDFRRAGGAGLRDESQEELSTDLSSRSTVSKGTCGALAGAHQLHHSAHHHHHHHHHQQHHQQHAHHQHQHAHHRHQTSLSQRAASTSGAPKLVTGHSKSTEPLYRMKHHQPHCQHYSVSQRHQRKQYLSQQHLAELEPEREQVGAASRLHQAAGGHLLTSEAEGASRSQRLRRTSSDLSDDLAAKNFRCRPGRSTAAPTSTKQRDAAPYLLLDPHLALATTGHSGEAAAQGFRLQAAASQPVAGHHQHLAYNNNGGQPRLHSASQQAVCREHLKRASVKFISQLYFLLHLSAILSLLLHHKSLTAAERKPTDGQPLAATSHSPGLVRTKKLAAYVNDSAFEALAGPQNGLLPAQALPQPMSQSSSPPPPSSSVNGAPESANNRFPPPRQVHSDFLVRLLGLWQARLVLHNFLSYLLLTSIAILVCMRLCRLCLAPVAPAAAASHYHQEFRSLVSVADSSLDPNTHASDYGFFQRTRLDCTPVLVGSISLSLIQLIMIGLDFANNLHTDWFTKARWPTAYLPFFQFAFVALLMQYILGKVAKNHELAKPAPPSDTKNNRLLGQPTISFDSRRFSWNSPTHSTAATGRSPVGHGFKNIALAHLLVTHILLWLLRLNSISLFRTFADDQIPGAPQSNPLTTRDTSGAHKHLQARHYNLSGPLAADATMVPDASFNMEANLPHRRPNDSHLASIFNRPLLEASKPPPKPMQPTSNKRSREAVDLYNKLEPRPISDSLGLQHFRLVPADPTSGLNLDAALSKSQQQLMELINLATRTRADLNSSSLLGPFPVLSPLPVALPPPPPPPPPPPLRAATPQVVTYIKTTNTSSLPTRPPSSQPMPKRPTVFRQSTQPLGLGGNLSTQTLPVTEHRRPLILSQPDQKHRVRVLLSRVENPPPLDSNYKRINRPQLKRINSLERPFPSVESDLSPPGARAPPSSTSLAPPGATTSTSTTTTSTSRAPTTPMSTSRPVSGGGGPAVVEVERDEAGNNSTGEEEPEEEGEEEGSGDTTEGPQAESYNETMSPPVPTRGPLAQASNSRLAVTDEEALLAHFGESTRLDTFTNPQALTSASGDEPGNDVIRSFAERASAFERRFLQDSEPAAPVHEPPPGATGGGDKLSFADYLVPIVQQYHILIIAILFNMWLEGLRGPPRRRGAECATDRKSGEQPRHMRFSDRRFLLGQPNLLSSGSDASRSRADPFGPSRLVHTSKQHLEGLAYRGASTRWQAYAVRKHLSQSMDSLRYPREPAAAAGRDDDSSSSLSRHNSLRSSSSEQLLSTSGRHSKPRPKTTSSRSPLLRLQQHPHQQVAATFPAALMARPEDKGLELSACSLLFGLVTVCLTLMVLVANQNYLSASAQCTILLASVLLCMVGLCLSNLNRFGPASQVHRYIQEPRHVQSLHLIFILAGYYCGITLLLNLDRRQNSSQQLPAPLLQFIQRHLLGQHHQVSQPFMFQLLLAAKGLLLVLQVTLQTVLIRASLNRPVGHLRQVYTSLMFANLGLWALELRDEQQFLNQHQHQHLHLHRPLQTSHLHLEAGEAPGLGLMNELASTLVTLSHFYHALVFLQR